MDQHVKDPSFENYVFPLLEKQALSKQGPGAVCLIGTRVSQVSLWVNEHLKVTLVCVKRRMKNYQDWVTKFNIVKISVGLNNVTAHHEHWHTGWKKWKVAFPRVFALYQLYEIYLVGLHAKMLHSSALAIQTKFTCVKRERKEGGKYKQDKQKRKKWWAGHCLFKKLLRDT